MKNHGLDNFGRSEFNQIFELTRKQRWLSDKSEHVGNLIFDECSSPEERELVFSLLSRFDSIDYKSFTDSLIQIVQKIKTLPNFNAKETIVLPLTVGSGEDSGQEVIYRIKSISENEGVSDWITANRADKLPNILKKINSKISRVVFVDEFLGSGETVVGRFQAAQKAFDDKCIDKPEFIACVVAAQKEGIENVEAEGIEVFATNTYKRGITDFYDDSSEQIQVMKNLENLLSKEFNGRKLPSLGYGAAEALYHREGGNTPNSVFPIFWWKYLNNGSCRKTVVVRNMRDA